MEELGCFANYKTPSVFAVKTLSESFNATGRLDAEYYQPKYDMLFEQLNAVETQALGDLVTIAKSIEPGSEAYQDKGIPFIRVQDFTYQGVLEPRVYLDPVVFGDALRPKKGTILLSKDGTVGTAYCVGNEAYDYITSSAILHLDIRCSKVIPEYLTLVLNSEITKLQAERDAGGSIINHWKPSEIERVRIPLMPLEIQSEITDKIIKSKELLAKSQSLIQTAVRAVEIAIESSEDNAMDFLKTGSNSQ